MLKSSATNYFQSDSLGCGDFSCEIKQNKWNTVFSIYRYTPRVPTGSSWFLLAVFHSDLFSPCSYPWKHGHNQTLLPAHPTATPCLRTIPVGTDPQPNPNPSPLTASLSAPILPARTAPFLLLLKAKDGVELPDLTAFSESQKINSHLYARAASL